MQKVIILTEEEYEELLSKQQEPSTKLREINKNLSQQYDKLREEKVTEVSANLTSPFKVEDNTLNFSTKEDFVSFFNHTASKQDINRPSLMKTDADVFNFLTHMCTCWNFNLPFKDVKALKSFRVSLVKTGMYSVDKNNRLRKVSS